MGVGYDFSNPFMQAALVTEDGETWPMWTNTDTSGTPTAAGSNLWDKYGIRSLSYVTDISVHLQLAFIPVITVTLTPPLNDARALLDSPLVEFGRSAIQVQLGYAKGAAGAVLSPKFEGLMQQPEFNFGIDTTITFHGQGMGFYTAVNTERSNILKGTRADILKQLAKGPDQNNPRKLDFDFSEVQSGSDAEAKKALFEVQTELATGNLTDWWLIAQMIRDCQCWFVVSGNKSDTTGKSDSGLIKVFPRNSATMREPKYTLAFYDYKNGEIGPTAGCFPILNISCANPAVYLPASTRGLVSKGIASDTKLPVKSEATDATVAPSRTGKGAGEAPPSPTTPGSHPETADGRTLVPVDIANDPEAATKARAEYLAGIAGMGLELDITTLGMPDIAPGDILRVTGVGKRLEANYGVFEIDHNIGASGFETRLKLISNTANMLKEAQATQAAGAKNEAKPPPAEAQGVVVKEAKKVR